MVVAGSGVPSNRVRKEEEFMIEMIGNVESRISDRFRLSLRGKIGGVQGVRRIRAVLGAVEFRS